MFSKILIANRGEIALRIIRACKELKVRTAIVYSEADRESLPVRLADESVCIGPKESQHSYLNIPAIISAAEITDVEAVHPGYGFLAENDHFAEICESCQIKFIGPSSKSMKKMGNKLEAKKIMKKAGIPVLPGSDSAIENKDEALKIAKEIKYPVILKAAAGGGGRGMRIAHNDVRLVNALLTARSEAENYFGNSDVYIEKYFQKPRHIEFQIIADNYGNVVHLGERDCSIQRRHQKLLEEAPSPALDEGLRREMGQQAITAVKTVNYNNVGTVEFLLDENNNYYFMEMNTRIQVEHPVTEMITDIDLVKEQIKIAAGEKLSYNQDHIKINGYAIECRINAEDPENDFLPSPGIIENYHAPSGVGVRVDSHCFQGYEIPPYYDSLVAKLITHGESRKEAIDIMKRSLDEFVIEPIPTTIKMYKEVLKVPEFLKGKYYTDFIDKFINSSKKGGIKS
jgi:acetyl-CoA carboxylase biotin carboxylase subunit